MKPILVLVLLALPFAVSAQGKERAYSGHLGASYGLGQLDASCPPNTGCDDSEQALRLFGGVRMNDTFGAEVGWLKLGDFSRGGGETDAQALDLALTAGLPFGTNWAVFGKLGVAYTRTDVTGTAPGLQTGKADGWGGRFGVGLQLGITPTLALRADVDRYRFKMPGGHENIDTYLLGVQYTLR